MSMQNSSCPPETQRCKGRPRCFDREKALVQALNVFWQRGFEPASITELCAAMGINAPSLYAAFGNKAGLFIEAISFYEKEYWEAPIEKFLAEPDIFRAVDDFFKEAATILLSPTTPCGCVVALSAINISGEASDILTAINDIRTATKTLFARKLAQCVADGQLPSDTDVAALAGALNTMLEGLSIQARYGLTAPELMRIASHAVRLLNAAH